MQQVKPVNNFVGLPQSKETRNKILAQDSLIQCLFTNSAQKYRFQVWNPKNQANNLPYNYPRHGAQFHMRTQNDQLKFIWTHTKQVRF